MKWYKIIYTLIFLLTFVPINLYANNNRKIEFVHISDTESQSILFIAITKGEYQCISDYVKNTKFSNAIIRSIDINITYSKNHHSLTLYESILKQKLETEKYNYIIILDEAKTLSDVFYDYMKSNFNNQFVTIGYMDVGDIQLFIDFKKVFLILNELEISNDLEVYFIHNSDNKINEYYKAAIKDATTSVVNDISVKNISELVILLNKIQNDPKNVIITNLDYLIDDVSGLLLYIDDILVEMNSKNVLAVISHNKCQPLNSKISIFWDMYQLSEKIDLVLKQTEHKQYKIVSSLGFNLFLNKNMIDILTYEKIKSVLKYMDVVIYDE